MNTKTEKIRRLSRILHIFAIIGGICLILGVAVCTYFAVNPPSEVDLTINQGFVKSTFPIELTEVQARTLFIPLAVIFAYMSVIFFIVSSIFKALSLDSTPFSLKRVKNLKLIALLVIPFNLALTAVLYCFALIFEYGVELQQQSDETI